MEPTQPDSNYSSDKSLIYEVINDLEKLKNYTDDNTMINGLNNVINKMNKIITDYKKNIKLLNNSSISPPLPFGVPKKC